MSTILVVEDDELVAMALQIRLESLGHAVISARNVAAAEQHALQQRPDLVLTDISMPGGDGFSLANRLNSQRGRLRIPVVFATASMDPVMRTRAEQAHAAGFLQKPFTVEQLKRTIATALAVAPASAGVNA